MTLVAILLPKGYSGGELAFVLETLREAAMKPCILGRSKGELIVGGRGESEAKADVAFDALDPEALCGALVLDGYWSDDSLQDQELLQFFRILHMGARPIGTSSRGIRVLAAAGVCQGCTLTCPGAERGLLESAGAEWIDAPTATCGHLISGQGHDNFSDVMEIFVPAVEHFQQQLTATEFLGEERPPG